MINKMEPKNPETKIEEGIVHYLEDRGNECLYIIECCKKCGNCKEVTPSFTTNFKTDVCLSCREQKINEILNGQTKKDN